MNNENNKINQNNSNILSTKKLSFADFKDFHGTSLYYKHSLPFGLSILLTDGCYFLREKAECHWLFDSIGSHLFINSKLKKYRQELTGLFWQVKLQDNSAVKLTCLYDKGMEIDSQTYPFSDISDYVEMKEIDIWTFPSARKNGLIDWIALLPSEY